MELRKINLMHRTFGKCDGHTCGECSNLVEHRYDKRYYKCKAYGTSRSEASDWAKRWQACGLFNRPWGDKPIMRLVRPTREDKEEIQSNPLERQIRMEGMRMDKMQIQLAKVIENYFGADAGYLDIDVFTLAKRIMEAGWTKQQWIPVTERLPEMASIHKMRRHMYTKSIRVLCVCVQKDGKKMVKEGYCELWDDYPEPIWKIPGTIDSVTRWMPLPEPPTKEDAS